MNLIRLLYLLALVSFAIHLSAQKYDVIKLEDGISTFKYDETAPVLSLDGRSLYFTRSGSPEFNHTLVEDSLRLNETMKPAEFISYLSEVYSSLAGRRISDPVGSSFNQDIWIATLDKNGAVEAVDPAPYPLNNALPNSVAALTPFEGELILVNQFPAGGGMNKGYSLSTRLGDTLWSRPRPLQILEYDNRGTDVTMCISADGSVLIYSMVGPNNTEDGLDLFVSFRQKDGSWSAPLRLDESVNTRMNETTPYLSQDDEKLFFASNRATAVGGYDIFVSNRLDDSWTRWSKPLRLVYPLNSSADDSQPFFDVNTGCLILASDRHGSQDIYRVKIASPNPVSVAVRGRVYHADTKVPLHSTVSVSPVKGDRSYFANTSYDATDGEFKLRVRKGKRMLVEARKQGYMPASKEFYFKRGNVYTKTYEIQLFLEPIAEGMRFDIKTLFFVQSKPDILEKSYPALDELAEFMLTNPSVSIRLEGHTDNVGREQDLQLLSEQRAQAVKAYLIRTANIENNRIKCVGMGAKKPLNDNSSEALRAMNRRVEVVIERAVSSKQ